MPLEAFTARLAGTRFVHSQRAPLKVAAVHAVYGLCSTVFHFDKSESSRSACDPVGDNLHSGDGSELSKRLCEVATGCAVGKVPNIQVITHSYFFEPEGYTPKYKHEMFAYQATKTRKKPLFHTNKNILHNDIIKSDSHIQKNS